MTGRIPSAPNDDEFKRLQLSAAQKKAEAQRVQKAEAVDDESRSKQKFKAMMQDSDDDDQAEEAQSGTSQPSPFETSFYAATTNSAPGPLDIGQKVPSPTYSPAPDLDDLTFSNSDYLTNDSYTPSTDPYSAEGLPSSLDAYQFNPEDPFAEPQFIDDKPPQRTTAPKSQNQKAPNKMEKGPAGIPAKKLEASPFSPHGHAAKQEKTPGKAKDEKTAQPQGQYWAKDEQIQARPTNFKSDDMKPAERKVPVTSDIEKPKEKRPLPKPFELEKEMTERTAPKEKDSGEQKKEGKKEKMEVIPPSLSTLPSSVEPMAQAAAVNAAPYLSHEVMSMFYQMVGTIHATISSGVSKTEFVLNSPKFANSKFFGATIELTKYSTAPNSFNVTLTGSTEAVRAFNQSIDSLKTAFDKGNFKFKIGRIDANYSTEKPVFHRKENDKEGKSR